MIKKLYRTIYLNPTTTAQTITGESTTLNYYVRRCGNAYCWNDPITNKYIGGKQTVEGTAPKTHLEIASGSVVLAAQTKVDESLRKDYWTPYVEVYDQADSVEDEDFIINRQKNNIWLNKENAAPEITCGEMISLKELLQDTQITQVLEMKKTGRNHRL